MRFLPLLLALGLAGCSTEGGGPIVIPRSSAMPEAPKQNVAQPALFNGEKYFMVNEADLNRFIAAYNKRVTDAKKTKMNAEVVNNEGFTELGSVRVNDFSLNNGGLISIDDLLTLPVSYVGPSPTEQEKSKDWHFGDYLCAVLVAGGAYLMFLGWLKKRKKEKKARENLTFI